MLQPKRTKYRKAHKGRIHGNAPGGASLNFGAERPEGGIRSPCDCNRASHAIVQLPQNISKPVNAMAAMTPPMRRAVELPSPSPLDTEPNSPTILLRCDPPHSQPVSAREKI